MGWARGMDAVPDSTRFVALGVRLQSLQSQGQGTFQQPPIFKELMNWYELLMLSLPSLPSLPQISHQIHQDFGASRDLWHCFNTAIFFLETFSNSFEIYTIHTTYIQLHHVRPSQVSRWKQSILSSLPGERSRAYTLGAVAAKSMAAILTGLERGWLAQRDFETLSLSLRKSRQDQT